ncbi:DNA adenine methylase [Paraburkholderia caribensis]|uniref:DNA adenine methylase n=1 Tax=Paraburkholderia caribensis TaxID=75105 RepID=UPI0007219285|nr:DNA adenine methylase [Paraburkholderia caribensis]ALP62409.1 restriction endonuclease subunit M [Paraburkholderia caribensis]AUT52365.1 restriction endonuclease subunit M [Paraburkholderia caribensis]
MASPIIPWIGGKRRLADHLIPRFPKHECYVEVFAGGAALYFMRPPAAVEVINDVNGELVNLYRIVQHHLEEFVRQFKWALSSRQVFKWLQDTVPETLTDIQRAARFYYLQQSCFGGKVEGQTFGTATTAPPGLNLLRLEENLSAAHLRLSSTYIENLDWKSCIDRYDRSHTLFYMDPPYWQTEGYGVPFPFSEYEEMAACLRSLKGKAIVSLNDHSEIRRAFNGFYIETVDIKYIVGGGGREASRKELIIFSWDDAAEPAGLF